jgi:hypothetical protein
VIGLEGGDLHHNGTHWRSLLISRKDRIPNRKMRTIRRLCAAGSADSILTGSRYLARNVAYFAGQFTDRLDPSEPNWAGRPL